MTPENQCTPVPVQPLPFAPVPTMPPAAITPGIAMYQLNADHNPHLVPLDLLLASALVPITFVIFCWEENTLTDLPLPIVGVTFLIGASFSLFVADVLEGLFASGTGVGQMVMVGL